MAQHYSNPKRANDPHALPDMETFYVRAHDVDFPDLEHGWYYWFCFPGCMPDSEPFGPFDTEAAALADAQEQEWDE